MVYDEFLYFLLGRALSFASLNICQELLDVRNFIDAVIIYRMSRCREFSRVVPVAQGEWSYSKNFRSLFNGYEFDSGVIHRVYKH